MLSVFHFSPTLWVFFCFFVFFFFHLIHRYSVWRSHCYLLPISNKIFSKTLFFKNIFRFPAKSRRTEIFHILPASIQTSPTVHMPYQSGTFVSTDEPTLTHRSHPKSIVTSGLTLGVVYSVGLDTHEMTHTHCYCIAITQSIFPAPKSSVIYPSSSVPQALATTDLFCCLSNLAFSIISGSWDHVICSLFRLTSFT